MREANKTDADSKIFDSFITFVFNFDINFRFNHMFRP